MINEKPLLIYLIDWRLLCGLAIGWLSGLVCGVVLLLDRLPPYDMVVENRTLENVLELEPASPIQVSLIPTEKTKWEPHLCAFTWDGRALTRWPVPHQRTREGGILIKGVTRDLLPQTWGNPPAIQELIFVVGNSLNPCQTTLATVLQGIDAATESWTDRRAATAIGIHTIRLPVHLHPKADAARKN